MSGWPGGRVVEEGGVRLMDPRDARCPKCGASPRTPCRGPTGIPAPRPHMGRVRAAGHASRYAASVWAANAPPSAPMRLPGGLGFLLEDES